jgi:hypothetical protein
MVDEYQVDEFKELPDAVDGRRSKYANRMTVVRERNKIDPTLWGKVGEFTNEGSARQRGSRLREEYKYFETQVIEGDAPNDWSVWVRYKGRTGTT